MHRGHACLWWDDDGGQERPVSYAGHTVPAHGVQRIGPVYTPPDHRGRGCASACTAAVAAGLRERGAAEVCLYTDVVNPTSNKIYQAIGFEPLHDTADLAFT